MMELSFVLLFLLTSVIIWFVLLRRVPRYTNRGTVRSKSFKPAGEYVQFPIGDRQGMRWPTRIPIAEGILIEIKLENSDQTVIAHLNAVEGRAFDVGAEVEFEYERRRVPFLWEKYYVFNVRLRSARSHNAGAETESNGD